MKFPTRAFKAFCANIVINSKEQGLCRFRWNGAQHRFIKAVEHGLANGKHRFVILKARQLGITTIMLALDDFWLKIHPGTQGGLAVSSETVRDKCRADLVANRNSLPKALRCDVLVDNRLELRFGNRSRLVHLIAGGRASGGLGRSQGLSYLHATEMSSWTDPEGILSLDASLATTNPKRLYIFESTARGYNLFQNMWEDAIKSHSTEAVFIGWWAREDYSLPRDGTLWPVYHRAKLSRDEAVIHKEVERRFHHVITPEQWAWWRWKEAETGDDRGLLAEFPFTPEQAFIMTGDGFFRAELLTSIAKHASKQKRTCWSYAIRERFEQTELFKCEDGPLSIWEEPVPGQFYIVSGDPAYGRSDWGDSFCAQVFKVSHDRMVQVAEFNSPDCTMYGFAWILAHLCGAYSSTLAEPTLILELSGPGQAVLEELQRMPSQYSERIAGLTDGARAQLGNLFGSIQHYLYRRADSFSGSRLLQWQTTARTKAVLMNELRDGLMRGEVVINSPEFAEESRYITQVGTRIEAEGRTHKDDRVVACGLAVVAWQQQVRPGLLPEVSAADAAQDSMLYHTVADWMARIRDDKESESWQNVGTEDWRE